jgi:AcrR family transcriptional regulator
VPKRSAEHLERRREQILAGARRCFARHGFEGATVNRLEQEIGLSRGAIFHYFPNKDALFIALAERDAEHRARLWRTHGLGAVAHAIGDEDPDWLNTYAELSRRVRNDPDFRRQWERRGAPLNQAVIDVIEEGREQGRIRTDLDPNTIAQFLVTVFDGLLLETRMFGLPTHTADVVALVEDALRPPADQ